MGAVPKLRTNGEEIRYDGRQVGQYGCDESTGEIVACFWKPLFRIENSYALTCNIEERIDDDISMFFVIDQDTVYRFDRTTYVEANIRYMNGQSQFVPDRDENTGVWDADDVLL